MGVSGVKPPQHPSSFRPTMSKALLRGVKIFEKVGIMFQLHAKHRKTQETFSCSQNEASYTHYSIYATSFLINSTVNRTVHEKYS